MGKIQHVEEAQLCEGSRLDLLHAVMVQMQLLQGGQPVKGFLQRSGEMVFKMKEQSYYSESRHVPGKGCQSDCEPGLGAPRGPGSGKHPPSP